MLTLSSLTRGFLPPDLPTHKAWADVRTEFHSETFSTQRRICTTLMAYTVAAFLLASFARQLTHPSAISLTDRLTCALGLALLTWRIAHEKSTFRFGLWGVVFVLLLEVGMALNACHSAKPLYWLLPAFVMIPVCASPLWLTPVHFICGTAAAVCAGAALMAGLPLQHDDVIVCALWACITLSTCVFFKVGAYRFRFGYFSLRQRLIEIDPAVAVEARMPDTSCVTRAEWAGIALATHFQPLYSLSHQTTVGFEVLLRGQRANGSPVAPPHIFTADPHADVQILDRLTQRLHFASAREALPAGAWLFLNVLPVTFLRADHPAFLKAVVEDAGLSPANIVLEVLESQEADVAALSRAASRYREQGFRIAIDDFGAGHSNLDRLLRIQPDIVKLDGELVRARCRSTARPLLPNLVSLLHDVGMLVVVEGIETEDDLAIAVASNADIAQGYLLGRPNQSARVSVTGALQVDQAFKLVQETRASRARAFSQQLAPYLDAMAQAVPLLQTFESRLPALSLLSLPRCYGCYLLDSSGRIIEEPCFPRAKPRPVPHLPAMLNSVDARWDNRPFFIEALRTAGQPVHSEPYHSLLIGGACVTLACAFSVAGKLTVLVCKLEWPSPLESSSEAAPYIR